MRTKITIAFWPDFPFYHALDDDDHIYLDIDGQVVRNPLPVWAVIRRSAAVDRSLADLDDDQLRVFAEQVVAGGARPGVRTTRACWRRRLRSRSPRSSPS